MKRISFLINPISLQRKQLEIETLIKEVFDSKEYRITIEYSESAEHLSSLAKKASANETDIAVAVGGDGTVHRVGKELIGSDTALGIIPIGSGNGFARHCKISLNPKTALKQIQSGEVIQVDTMRVGDEIALNVAGVGFEGRISHLFATSKVRGFESYLWNVLKEFASYKAKEYKLRLDNQQISRTAFSISVCNGSQWGNNFIISPQAKIEDGFLEVVIINAFPKWKGPMLSYRLFTGTIDRFHSAEVIRCKSIEITSNSMDPHADGEPLTQTNRLVAQILPKSLKIVMPLKHYA